MNFGPPIITNGLVLYLDAANRKSYPGGGTSWLDLSGNNYNFTLTCTGTSCSNPTYSANSISTNFVTSSPYNFSYLYGNNLNSQLLQLLYSNHTIEMCFKLNSASTVYSYNNALTNESNMALFCWVGYHAGILMANSTFYYTIYNSTTNGNFIPADATPFVGQNIVLHCIRSSNDCSIYINGVLKNTVTISPPASYPHANIRIGCGNTVQPTSNNYTFASNATYYSIKCYNIAFTQAQVLQNYNAVKTRFGL